MLLDFLQVLAVVFGAATPVMQRLVDDKDTKYRKSRNWRRARFLPMLFNISAIITLFMVNRIDARTKQVEIQHQQNQIARIAGNVDSLVLQGKLSRDEAT